MSTTIPLPLKTTVTERVNTLLTNVLAPRHVIPRPPDYRWGHPIALYCHWWRSSCYLCATYRHLQPDAAPVEHEERFVRLTYQGRNRFTLAYFRHTGRWQPVYADLTLAACLQAIATQELFWP